MIYMYWSTEFSKSKLCKALGYDNVDTGYLLSQGILKPQELPVTCLRCHNSSNVLVRNKSELKQTRRIFICNTCLHPELKTPKELYKEYLNSDHWESIRNIALDIAGYKCQLCSSKDTLNVHHNNYDNLNKETMKDLIVL